MAGVPLEGPPIRWSKGGGFQKLGFACGIGIHRAHSSAGAFLAGFTVKSTPHQMGEKSDTARPDCSPFTINAPSEVMRSGWAVEPSSRNHGRLPGVIPRSRLSGALDG